MFWSIFTQKWSNDFCYLSIENLFLVTEASDNVQLYLRPYRLKPNVNIEVLGRVCLRMIFLTGGVRIFILERASGEFHDENSVPECKKYHTLAHKIKNLFLPRPIDKQTVNNRGSFTYNERA